MPTAMDIWFTPAVTAFAGGAPVRVELEVEDMDNTTEWLRSGAARRTGCLSVGVNRRPFGAKRDRQPGRGGTSLRQ